MEKKAWPPKETGLVDGTCAAFINALFKEGCPIISKNYANGTNLKAILPFNVFRTLNE